MTVSNQNASAHDVFLSPSRSSVALTCGLPAGVVFGAVLLYFAYPTIQAAVIFVVLCGIAHLCVIGLLHHAMSPIINLQFLARHLYKFIRGARLRACTPRFGIEEDACLEGGYSTIVLRVPSTSDFDDMLGYLAFFMRLHRFVEIERQSSGSVASGTRMLFRNRMVSYGIVCSLRPPKSGYGSHQCVVHIVRQVG